jgi:glycosyltransferase involved in cell wall biosynthesis
MNIFSNNAQEFVKNWTWNNIAKQYTILFKAGLFTTIEATKSFTRALVNDPYENEPVLIDTEKSVYWTNRGAMSFDEQDVFLSLIKDNATGDTYTIYADSFLQLNGKIVRRYENETVGLKTMDEYVLIDRRRRIQEFKVKKYEIETVGLKTMDEYVLIDRHRRIQEFKVNKQNFTSPIQIDYIKEKIIFTSININLEISCSKNEITIHFLKVNRFTNAFGLIGSTIRTKKLFMQNNITQTIKPLKWFIPEQDIFSHTCEGQRLSMFGMEYNAFILPERAVLRCSEHKSQKTKVIMETEFFGASGFSSVSRRIFLSLIRNSDFVISLRPNEKDVQPYGLDLEAKLAYSLFLRQDACIKAYRNSALQELIHYSDKTIVFRNGWPPNSYVASDKEIIIHQLPIEFHAIPKDWLPYLQHKIHDLWVPSQYCKSSFISNGVPESKIHVIPHGVYTEKFQMELPPLELPTKKTFKFLAVGGLVRRKGFDLLLNAYRALFSSKDDVTLIIHSIYMDSSGTGLNVGRRKNSTSPEVVQLRGILNDMDMIRLFKSVDVYVSPYRGEGFGLSILEAMAAGVPPIVTKYGPSLDFCPEECGYFVEARLTQCLRYPCGHMKLFGSDTVVQPMWAVPKIESLKAKLYQAYTDRVELRKKSKICQKHAEYYTWDKIADKIIKRISEITQ